MEEHLQLKKSWGALSGIGVAHDIGGQVVDFVEKWAYATELSHRQMVGWMQLSDRKFRKWRSRYGKVKHNRLIPREHWLEE